jgi:hypothetical protein
VNVSFQVEGRFDSTINPMVKTFFNKVHSPFRYDLIFECLSDILDHFFQNNFRLCSCGFIFPCGKSNFDFFSFFENGVRTDFIPNNFHWVRQFSETWVSGSK